jgi:hypothetical protein
MRRLPLILCAAVVVVLVILAFQWLMGLAFGVFFAPFALVGLLLDLIVVLGFVALVTMVVGITWRWTQRR